MGAEQKDQAGSDSAGQPIHGESARLERRFATNSAVEQVVSALQTTPVNWTALKRRYGYFQHFNELLGVPLLTIPTRGGASEEGRRLTLAGELLELHTDYVLERLHEAYPDRVSFAPEVGEEYTYDEAGQSQPGYNFRIGKNGSMSGHLGAYGWEREIDKLIIADNGEGSRVLVAIEAKGRTGSDVSTRELREFLNRLPHYEQVLQEYVRLYNLTHTENPINGVNCLLLTYKNIANASQSSTRLKEFRSQGGIVTGIPIKFQAWQKGADMLYDKLLAEVEEAASQLTTDSQMEEIPDEG